MAADDQINISVTATTDSFDSSIKKTVVEIDSFSKSLNEAAARAQALDPTAFKTIAQDLNSGTISATGVCQGT